MICYLKNLFIISLISASAFANSVELIGGGVTYRFYPTLLPSNIGSSQAFNYSPSFGMSYVMNESGRTYTTVSIFGGANEIFSPTFGGTVSYGLHNKFFYFGGIAGGYLQNNQAITNAGLVPVTLSSPNSIMGFTPIIGVELNFRWYTGEKTYIKFNNVVTPAYTNHSIGLGFDL